MTIALESMAVTMPEVEGHPNRAAFRGVLTVVDEPSQRAPSGSRGRRVLLTRGAAEAALPSLLGMALDYAPSFDRHDVRRKVGVITSAEMVGRNLEVGGYLYAKDFPDIVAEIEKSGRRTVDSSASSGADTWTSDRGLWAAYIEQQADCGRTWDRGTGDGRKSVEGFAGGRGGTDSEFDGGDSGARGGVNDVLFFGLKQASELRVGWGCRLR